LDIGAGHLVLISPHKIERNVPKLNARGPDDVQDRITADLVVLDGAPFMWGGDPEGFAGKGSIPHDKQASIPHESLNMWINQALLVLQLERSIGSKVLGRLNQKPATQPGRRPSWTLDNPTDADRELARQYLAAKARGEFNAPAPQPQAAPIGQPAMQGPPPGYQQVAPPVAPPQAAAQTVNPLDVVPTGWDPTVWGNLPEVARQQVLNSLSAAAGPGI
jgi:hypothetical protein